MTINRLWCSKCKKEFTSDEAVEKEVDTMFGEGRWWHCRVCGTKLILYPTIGEKEKKFLIHVQTSLATIKNNGSTLSPNEICILLFQMQQFYSESHNGIDACHVLFNIKEIAQQNNLPEFAITADKLYKRVAKTTLGIQKEEVLSVSYLLERFIAYYYPQ
jgi:hypothetical protein